jgi:preprotein translocase subunit SecG
MSFIAGLLTVILLLNSLLLILLVLVQLPKKDAGAGLAFGGGAADALFGAGSGNALTKITKWGTVAFIVVALVLGFLQDSLHGTKNDPTAFLKSLDTKASMSAQPVPQPVTSAPNNLPATTPILSTNTPATATTNK